eukprot:scaffold113322_cov18-Tisochrysis_lutea.AAC.1
MRGAYRSKWAGYSEGFLLGPSGKSLCTWERVTEKKVDCRCVRGQRNRNAPGGRTLGQYWAQSSDSKLTQLPGKVYLVRCRHNRPLKPQTKHDTYRAETQEHTETGGVSTAIKFLALIRTRTERGKILSKSCLQKASIDAPKAEMLGLCHVSYAYPKMHTRLSMFLPLHQLLVLTDGGHGNCQQDEARNFALQSQTLAAKMGCA